MSSMNLILAIPAGTTTITIPLTYPIATSVTINWGDSSSNTWTVTTLDSSNPTHVYTGAQTPTVTITATGTNGHFGNQTANMAQYITSVTQWGTIGISDYSYAFYNATNLTSVSNSTPSGIINMSNMFNGCTIFNQSINFTTTTALTNTSNMFTGCVALNNTVTISTMTSVNNMSNMFYGCTSFNKQITFTTTQALTNVRYMFYGCSELTILPSISLLTNVTNMSFMFYGCGKLNQPISFTTSAALTDVSYMFALCTSLNSTISISSVIFVRDMSYMFYGCTVFNKPLYFNTSSIQNTSYMFNNCTAFNSSLVFTSTSFVTNMSYMFYGAKSFNYPVKLNIYRIPSGQSGSLSTGLLNMFRNTGLSRQNYSIILNYFASILTNPTFNSFPKYINLGTVSNGSNKLIPHATTSAYSILTGYPNYWSITDGGTISFTPIPSEIRYNPIQIKNTDPTISSIINDSVVLTKSYNTCQLTATQYDNSSSNSLVSTSYNSKTVTQCLGNTINIGNDFTTINLGTSLTTSINIGTTTSTLSIGNITVSGNTIGSISGGININPTILYISPTTLNMTPTTLNMTPTNLNMNPTSLSIFNNTFRYVPRSSYTPTVSNGACTNLFGSYSIMGNTMFLKIWGNSSGGGTAGTSGIYAFSIPSGYSIATTAYTATPTPTNGYIVSANSSTATFGGTTVGNGIIQQGSAPTLTLVVAPYSTTQICGYTSSNTGSTTENYHSYNWNPFTTASLSFSYDCSIPLQ